MTSVRCAAARVLRAVDGGHATLAAELDRERAGLADDRDRGLLGEITTGALRWQAELDAVLAHASARAMDAIDPTVRAVLRVGAYQLLHLDRVPAHAAIDEAVESARALGHPRAAGFVNAVLRGVQRGPTTNALPPRPAMSAGRPEQLAYLATTLSHPAWLVERWIARYGFEAAERWCRFNNTTPSVTVRAASPSDAAQMLEALEAAHVGATRASQAPEAITLPPGGLGRLPARLRDRLVVQDEASQLVAHVVGAQPGMRCLDVCAAPGGKTDVIWRDMGEAGLLVASDRRPGRVRLLRTTLRRSGVPPRIVVLDATQPLPFDAVFDRVLVDAPCSGLGTIRRDPDLKWRRKEADLARLAGTQHLMLRRAGESVRDGGLLVYATCSSEPEENEAVVEAFLESDRRFVVQSAATDRRHEGAAAFVDGAGFFRTLPFRDGLDAFFAAVLVRSGTA
jgi:16S rRNA (cytosine967-C5)-methyltransferase